VIVMGEFFLLVAVDVRLQVGPVQRKPPLRVDRAASNASACSARPSSGFATAREAGPSLLAQQRGRASSSVVGGSGCGSDLYHIA